MIRAYLYHDPDEKDPHVRAFRLARLELTEHLAKEEGVPHERMAPAAATAGGSAGPAGDVYLLLEAEGAEGRRAFSGLLLALDGLGASQSLALEFETAAEYHHLESLPLPGALIGSAGTLIPPLRPA